MLNAIVAVIAIQIAVVVLLVTLVAGRALSAIRIRSTAVREARLEPLVLNLLVDPDAIEPFRTGLKRRDAPHAKRLLLRQAAELRGQDRVDMTLVFERLGFVEQEIRGLRSRRWWRRLAAAISLGTMRSAQASDALVHAASDANDDVSLAAARALGQLDDNRGIPVLLDAMESGERWSGMAIAEILFGMGPIIEPVLVPRLWSTPEHDLLEPRVLTMYLQLTGLLRLASAAESIIPHLRSPHAAVRAAAAAALGHIGDGSIALEVAELVHDDDPDVRAAAADALGRMGAPAVAAELERALLCDGESSVRHGAAASLLALGGDAESALERIAATGSPPASTAAAQVLSEHRLGV